MHQLSERYLVCPHTHRHDHSVPQTVGGGPGLLDLLPLVDWGPGAPCSEVVTGAGLQDRKIAHCPFHMLMPAERETFLARKKLLEYMGLQLRQAVFAKEGQWDLKVLHLSKRGGRGGCSAGWVRGWVRGRGGQPAGWAAAAGSSRSSELTQRPPWPECV